MLRVWTLVALCWCTGTAHADDDRTRAKVLFEEGRALVQAGDVDKACARFARSLELDPTAMGTQMNVADCLERQGKLVRAHALFEQAALELARTSDARAEYAANRAKTVGKKVPTLTIRLPAPMPDNVIVTIDGKPVGAEPTIVQRVDPGVVEVTAVSGERSFKQQVALEIGASATLDVSFDSVPTTTTAPRAPEGPRDRGRVRLSKWLVLGGGLALGTAGGLGLTAKRHYRIAFETDCRPNLYCNQDGLDRTREARLMGNIGTAFAVVGGAALVGAVLVYATAPREQPAVTVSPSVSASTVGVSVGGAF